MDQDPSDPSAFGAAARGLRGERCATRRGDLCSTRSRSGRAQTGRESASSRPRLRAGHNRAQRFAARVSFGGSPTNSRPRARAGQHPRVRARLSNLRFEAGRRGAPVTLAVSRLDFDVGDVAALSHHDRATQRRCSRVALGLTPGGRVPASDALVAHDPPRRPSSTRSSCCATLRTFSDQPALGSCRGSIFRAAGLTRPARPLHIPQDF